MSNREGRDSEGKYKHTTLDKLCVCGHTLGVHSAEKVKGYRPCFNGDIGEACDCECFKPAKVKRG